MQQTPSIALPDDPLLTSLDPIETTVEIRSLLNHPFPTVHASHHSTREELIVALATSKDRPLIRRARSIAHCCAFPSMRRCEGGETSLTMMRCRDRLCPLCAKTVARKTAARVSAVIRPWDQCRHLTLTLAATTDPLGQQIDKLLSSFRRLRQRSFWATEVRGGIGTIEVTFNQATQQWHPHLHLLLDGNYLPHGMISSEWSMVTGGSFIVHITAVHSKDDAGRYISKYVTKPSTMGNLPHPRLCELASAMSGRRQLITFGKAHNSGLPVADPKPSSNGVRYLLSVHAIVRAVRVNKPFAMELMTVARHQLPSLFQLVNSKVEASGIVIPNGLSPTKSSMNNLIDQVKWWDDYGDDPPGCGPGSKQDDDWQMKLFAAP